MGDNYDGYRLTGALAESAVPEPASITMLGVGAISAVVYAWRRRKQTAV